MTHDLLPPPGIRVVRVLARGQSTERLLVQVETEGGAIPAEIERAIEPAGVDRVRRAIAALDRLSEIGIGGPIDVLGDAVGPAILIAHQRGATLADLLAHRSGWQAGEAVSVLAPLSNMLDRMHGAGVAHGALGAARVTMTIDGPALTGLDQAELFPIDAPEVIREAVEGVNRDREALRGLALEILGGVRGAREVAAGDLQEVLATVAPPLIGRTLTSGLAQLAAAVPIRFETLGAGIDHGAEPDAGREQSPSSPSPHGVLHRIFEAMSGEEVIFAIVTTANRVRFALTRLPRARRRIAVGGAIAVALSGVLLAVIPIRAPEVVDRTPGSETAAAEFPAEDRELPPGDEDDPADAVVSLLERRETCFRELSVLCLDGVDQLGSTALAIDRAAIKGMLAGEPPSTPTAEATRPRVVERLGDAALVEVGPETAPASLLVMRSEAGWRIRDWIASG